MITLLCILINFFNSFVFCVKIVGGINFLYLDEKNFSEIFLIDVGLLIIFALFLIVSRMWVVEIYSRLNGGSCLINMNLQLVKSNFFICKILKNLFLSLLNFTKPEAITKVNYR